eukprot:TRINITY_DN16714_c0_g1_i1.p1 TRINITY_DN16714_c0_g1~~TRINITY_DN16714_c0_g1_i1.p1  ORF type:complete len:169 (-),score=50.17 TRINITY_DN16714_c0_g1_i1:164-670(-)
MVFLDEATFLVRLVDLFELCREKGSVWVGMKRYSGDAAARKKRKPEEFAQIIASEEARCLVRARCSLKAASKRISTVVNAKDLVRFQLALENIMSLHMGGMKTRPKKKEKTKAAAKGVKKDAAGKKDAAAKAEEAAGASSAAPATAASAPASAAAAPAAAKQKAKKKR